jgi:hypothetical protein
MIETLIRWPDQSLEPTPVDAGSSAVPPSFHFGVTSAVGVAVWCGSVLGDGE